MYTFLFTYADKQYQLYKNIAKVEYQTLSEYISVSGKDILTHLFPFKYDMKLIAENGNYTVSHQGLISIEITS